MERCVHELLEFYQREMREKEEGRKLLERFGATSLEVIEHFKLGYCSGKALDLASDVTARKYKELGLVYRAREIFTGCVIFPVLNEASALVDLFGMRYSGEIRRYLGWQDPSQGLLGIGALQTYSEVVLAESGPYLLQTRQQGIPNVIGLRLPQELPAQLPRLKAAGLKKIYLLSRKHRPQLEKDLATLGVPIEVLKTNSDGEYLREANFAPVKRQAVREGGTLRLERQGEGRMLFRAGEYSYRVDTPRLGGLRGHVRAEREGRRYLDRLDLGSASGRQRFAKGCAMALLGSSLEIEEHLQEMTALIDLQQEAAENAAARIEVLSSEEERRARALLESGDLLEAMSNALAESYGIVGEEANRKLALLVGASRLLPKPLGCIVRGAPSSGKSSLIQAAARLLPESQLLNFSRLTPQALYFLPRESLLHSVMVVDEYEGLAESEYSLRTLMSNQMLSVAITVRDGGGLPTTRTVQIPAKVAVFVSTTQNVNDENLSRFVELKMDTSAAQTRRVLARLATGVDGNNATDMVTRLRHANLLLKPCEVWIPYAERLGYGGAAVLARRQFGHVIGLVSAHAALHQYQRKREKLEGGRLRVEASPEDYRVVFSLASHIVGTVEETLSPVAMELLQALHRDGRGAYTVQDVMELMQWTYSRSYRRLGELAEIRLVTPDHHTNGVQRVYAVAPYALPEGGQEALPTPEGI